MKQSVEYLLCSAAQIGNTSADRMYHGCIKRTEYSIGGWVPFVPMTVGQWRMKPKKLDFQVKCSVNTSMVKQTGPSGIVGPIKHAH